MHQRLSIIGHLGADPSMRYSAEGTPVTTFSVATSRKWTDASGQMQERTTWFRVTAWRRLAETCNQYLNKGRLVFVEGELIEPKPYQGKDGTWRASLDVTALNVKFLSGKNDGAGSTSSDETPAAPSDDGTEEIPF